MPIRIRTPLDSGADRTACFDFSLRLSKAQVARLRLSLQSARELERLVQIPCSIAGPGQVFGSLAGATVLHAELRRLRHSARHPALAPLRIGREKALHAHRDSRPAPLAVFLRLHIKLDGCQWLQFS